MAATPDIPDTPADPGTINAAAAKLDTTTAALTGHGTDIHAAINTAAFQFSDIVAVPIRDLATKNQAVWEGAVKAVTYGSGITKLWAQNVQHFKDERNKLLTEWQNALSTRFGLRDPYVPGGATEQQAKEIINTYNTGLANAQNAKAGDITTRAHALLEALRTDANARAGQIQRDATDADLLQLSRAGTLSWAAYVAFGKQNDPAIIPPVTEADAAAAANTLNRAANGEKVDPNEVRRALDLLAHVNSGVAAAVAAGAGISAATLGYLAKLYNDLGNNIFKLPAYFQDKSGFNAADQQKYQRALGAGLLNLSNDKIGGGFDKLPPAIKTLLTEDPGKLSYEFPKSDSDTTKAHYSINREGDWVALAKLLGATGRQDGDPASYQPPTGGREFSTRLTYQIDKIIQWEGKGHAFERDGTDHVVDGLLNDHKGTSGLLQTLVGVSTRNHDSNYDILTGKDNERFVRDFVGYGWTDKGGAAAGLTNWIADDANAAHANGKQDAHANEAAAKLIDLLGRGSAIDQNSNYGFTFKNLEQNSAFANSFSKIAISHLGDLSESYLQDANGNPLGTGVDKQGSLYIDGQDRRAFLALIGRNDQAFGSLAEAAGSYEHGLYAAVARGELDPALVGNQVLHLNSELFDARTRALDDLDTSKELTAAEKAKANSDAAFWIDRGSKIATTLVGLTPEGQVITKTVKAIAGAVLGDAFTIFSGDVKSTSVPPVDHNAQNHVNRGDAGLDADTLQREWAAAQVEAHGPLASKIPADFTVSDGHGGTTLRKDLSQLQLSQLSTIVGNDPQWNTFRTEVSKPAPRPGG